MDEYWHTGRYWLGMARRIPLIPKKYVVPSNSLKPFITNPAARQLASKYNSNKWMDTLNIVQFSLINLRLNIA